MEYILNNPWLSSIVVLVTQVLYIYLRTLNIIHTGNSDVKSALLSSIWMSFTWLISMAIGLNSVLTGSWQPIIAFLVGNALGTYYGMVRGVKSINYKNK